MVTQMSLLAPLDKKVIELGHTQPDIFGDFSTIILLPKIYQ